MKLSALSGNITLIGLLLITTDKVFVRLSANILINEGGMVSNHTTLILPRLMRS